MAVGVLSVEDIVCLLREDVNSPTTSTFTGKVSKCRNTVSSLDDILEQDKSCMTRIKKSVKALCNSGSMHIQNENLVSENLGKMGPHSTEQDKELVDAFSKFSIVTKELSGLMQNLMQNLSNMVLFPLDLYLKGETKELKKPFDKAWKDYDAKFSKIEKEKKQQAKEAGMVRTEVSGHEVAEEMEKERRVLQLQMCEYMLRANDSRTKKGVDLLQHLVEYYQAQTNFYRDGLKTMEHFNAYIEKLLEQLSKIRQKQELERRGLVELRDTLKTSLTDDNKEGSTGGTGYSLHQLQGNKDHGTQKIGYLFKKSDGKMRKVWQRRRCTVKDGVLSIGHSDESKEPVKLHLLTCQIKLVPDDKRCFHVVSGSKNRTYYFQAEDHDDMQRWISVLNNAKEAVLLQAFGEAGGSKSAGADQNMKELTQTIIKQVQRLPGNKYCADCGAPDPEWLSVNLGVLVCLECCGVHRDLGVHISRTQSIVIDDLATSELLLARVMSNRMFNDIMEATLDSQHKPKVNSSMDERKTFIRAKYEKRRYAIATCSHQDDWLQDLKQAVLQHDLPALLQVYAEQGGDLMAPLSDTETKNTALHLAVLQDDKLHLQIVYFIVQNANSQSINTTNKQGNTALHLCARDDKTECMKLILRINPKAVEITNNEGKTAMDLARENHNELCVKLLQAAVTGDNEHFDHVNVDWDLIDENQLDDFSDDDLDMTFDRRMGSRPSSLVMPAGAAVDSVSIGSQLLRNKLAGSVDNIRHTVIGAPPPLPAKQHTGSTSSVNLAGVNKKKAPAPPPPGIRKGHMRHPSDPGFRTRTHMRRPSDPPPLPIKMLTLPPGAKLVLPPPPEFGPAAKSPHQSLKSNGMTEKPALPPKQHIKAKMAAEANVMKRILIEDGPELVPPPLVNKSLDPFAVTGSRYRALYDCEADNEDELTFKEGEIIIMTNKDEEEEWWEGYVEKEPQRKGLFPSSFVTVITDM